MTELSWDFLDEEELVAELFEESPEYEEELVDWAFNEGADQFLWTDRYQRAYEKWFERKREEANERKDDELQALRGRVNGDDY